MAEYKLKHTGAVIDQQIDRVIDGSVVVDNTLSALDETSNKPVSGGAVAKELAERDTAIAVMGLNKVDKVVGRNLLDPSRVTRGFFFWNYNDNTPVSNSNFGITDYIPVTGNVVLNTDMPSGMGGRVYDKNFNILRVLKEPQYIFQDGDAYVRFSIRLSELDSLMVSEGTEVLNYEPYTDKADVVMMVEDARVDVGLVDTGEIISSNVDSYSSIPFNIKVGHTYSICNTSEVMVADVKTRVNDTTVDRVETINAGEEWRFVATGDATEVRAYFAKIGQILTVKEVPSLDVKSIVEELDTLKGFVAKEVPYVVWRDEDIQTTIQAQQNGCVMRRRGFDISAGNSGNGSMVQFSVIKCHKQVVAEFIVNTNIPADKFSQTWGAVTQMGSGLVKVTVTPALNTRRMIDCFLVHYSLDTDRDWHLRLAEVRIYPQTAEAASAYASVFSKDEPLLFDVFSSFDETTEGYGVNRFANIVDAHDGVIAKCDSEIYDSVIRVMPGTYNFADYFPITDSEEGYVGILARGGTTFQSYDVNSPETTRIEWDGHDGLDDNVKLTSQQAMARSPFHINTYFMRGERPTIIKGFHFICANIRYCVHPESAGYGDARSWIISNCILDWNGSDKVDGFNGRNLGIGISCGEQGLIEQVKFGGKDNKGIAGHNNGYALSQNSGGTPLLMAGGKLIVRQCDLQGGDIYMTTYKHDNTTPYSLIVEGCSNVNKSSFGFENSVTGSQEWRGTSINSDIADNQM